MTQFTNATATIESEALRNAGYSITYELDLDITEDADDARAEALESIRAQAEGLDDGSLAILDAIGDEDDQQADLYAYSTYNLLNDAESGTVEYICEAFGRVQQAASEHGIDYDDALELINEGYTLDSDARVSCARNWYELADAEGIAHEIPRDYHSFVDWAELMSDEGWHESNTGPFVNNG